MNIFDQLRDIITDKRNTLADDVEMEKEFVPYIVQRWLSFYSNQFAVLVNSSTNRLWKGIEDKQTWYKLFTGITPRAKVRNVRYIKKTKETKTSIKIDKEIVTYLAERFEISKKEVSSYLESGTIDIKLLKKQLQSGD